VLGRYFGERYCERLNRPRPALSTCAIERLLHYDWPGNVRELQNFIERVIILKSGRTVTAHDIDRLLQLDGPEPTAQLLLRWLKNSTLKKSCARHAVKSPAPAERPACWA